MPAWSVSTALANSALQPGVRVCMHVWVEGKGFAGSGDFSRAREFKALCVTIVENKVRLTDCQQLGTIVGVLELGHGQGVTAREHLEASGLERLDGRVWA